MAHDNAFLELVQQHERNWGTEQYPQRPSLGALLSSPIVAMWVANKPTPAEGKRTTATAMPSSFMLTAHNAYEELDDLATSIVATGAPTYASNWRLSRLYVNQKLVRVRVQLQILED